MGNKYLCCDQLSMIEKGSIRESVGTLYLLDSNSDNNRNNNRNNINNINSIISSSNNTISNDINNLLENNDTENDDNEDESFSESQNNNLLIDPIFLRKISTLNPDKKACTICLEDFNIKDKVINLECLHMFHNNCINNWLTINNFCPVCKNKIK